MCMNGKPQYNEEVNSPKSRFVGLMKFLSKFWQNLIVDIYIYMLTLKLQKGTGSRKAKTNQKKK